MHSDRHFLDLSVTSVNRNKKGDPIMQDKPKPAQNMTASERIEEISKIIALAIIAKKKRNI
ncbi:hypothetical protein [Pseudemcibacter aquimaris]|mgnify:CR=1 FL=1|uniref:hypothetical protein n=1 Tax=Pseudemcibacter aquimaris TaxID=2857064 RepID=UPI000C5BF0F0|nr:hypothetical protein [Pseudemcibacter aquimaris]MAF97729.1 hypothetical protein [Micavibrio sp.]MCC3862521.1 hypothetical protein [Pseudemcibacter aquimaris]WDU57783.1 hypothetical protein KW060_11300 [Pseudemcibacter aquimaris]|tara:strand:- start:848 stop:1030 length:183 start_codon:yes stop_codon:yes gene_type:complete